MSKSSFVLLRLLLAAGAFALHGCSIGEAQLPGEPARVISGEAERVSAAVAAESARLDEWFAARFEEELDFSPMEKTRLGRKDGYDEIDDFSERVVDERLEWRRRTVGELEREFDYALLDWEAKTSYDVWVYQYEQASASRPFLRHRYIFEQMNGPQAALPQFLINFHAVDSVADLQAYASRIAGISRALQQLLERAKLSAEEGIRPPRFAYDGVLEQARAVVTGAPFDGAGDSPLWADALGKIDRLAEQGKIDAERAESLRGTIRAVLLDPLEPAYRSLIEWLEEDRPNADVDAAGVAKLPDGDDYYARQLAVSTTTPLSAQQIHEIGRREVARIRAEMETIRSAVGFAGTLDEFFAFVREDERFYFADIDDGRDAYLEEARSHLARIEQRLPEYFGLLPRADLVVRRVEAFREQPGAAQHYQPGAPDGTRPGVFYVHLSDMRAMPRPMLEVIAYHEGLPGHHMQISIAQELVGLPRFRTQSFFTAYTEGWALYAERLAAEMGGYEDPYSEFGRLTSEIWRAVRLVVDTGLHAMGWSEEDAVAYFTANSAAADGQIRSEVRRYIVWPGQATAYMIGMLEIIRLRDEAERELGDAFDLRGFHDRVLGGGALPLSILGQRVDDWIAAERSAVSTP